MAMIANRARMTVRLNEVRPPSADRLLSPLSKPRAIQRSEKIFVAATQTYVRTLPIPSPTQATKRTFAREEDDEVCPGIVLYIGLDPHYSSARSTDQIDQLVTRLRRCVRSVNSGARTYAAMTLAPGHEVSNAETALTLVRAAFSGPQLGRQSAAYDPVADSPAALGLTVDLDCREVTLDGERVGLTYREFELLRFFVTHAQRTVVREDLLRGVWRSSDRTPSARTVDVHIWRLRSKLGRLSGIIRTVRGIGYRFFRHPEVSIVSQSSKAPIPGSETRLAGPAPLKPGVPSLQREWATRRQ